MKKINMNIKLFTYIKQITHYFSFVVDNDFVPLTILGAAS